MRVWGYQGKIVIREVVQCTQQGNDLSLSLLEIRNTPPKVAFGSQAGVLDVQNAEAADCGGEALPSFRAKIIAPNYPLRQLNGLRDFQD